MGLMIALPILLFAGSEYRWLAIPVLLVPLAFGGYAGGSEAETVMGTSRRVRRRPYSRSFRELGAARPGRAGESESA
ncbi:MAG: hypothetical protein R3B96_18830 [Pirellulaceae bacterium]